MAFTPTVIAPPRAEPARFGLVVSSREVAPADADEGRFGTYTWAPELCATSGVVDGCDFTDEFPDAVKEISDPDDDVELFGPYTVWAGYRCSTFGPDQAERERRARNQLAVSESRAIEREFWSGDYSVATTLGLNFFLTASHRVTKLTTSDTPGDPGYSSPLAYGLAALEEAAAGVIGRAMIHATVPTVTGWYGAGLLRREGNLLLTALDTIVVPGAGYDGSGPGEEADATGEVAWAFATGLVEVRRGPVRVLGATPVEGVNREQNVWETRAERLVATIVDPCAHFGIRVNLCETFCDPS